MARTSDLSPTQVGWTSEWYLRHDTLEHATGAIAIASRRSRSPKWMGTGERSGHAFRALLLFPWVR